MRHAHPRRLVALALIVSAALLGGCQGGEKTATVDLATDPYPALERPRVEGVLAALGQTLTDADANHDADALAARVAEPALSMRRGEYSVNDADNDLALTALTVTPAATTVTSGPEWPRAILDVTTLPEGENATPRVLLLTQPDARSPYKLTQWMSLLPNQSVPPTARIEEGSRIVAADAEGYQVSPAAARDAWASGVADDQAREEAGLAVDEFMTNIRDEQSAWREAIGDKGTLNYEVTPSDSVVAIADKDGGLLVATSFTYRTDVDVTKDAIRMGGDIGALLGEKGEVKGKAHWSYTVCALFRIPAAGQDAQTRMIAGSKVLTEAARD